MEDALKRLSSQLADFWNSLTRKRKIALIGTLVGSAAVIAAIVLIANSVSYSVLYAGLDAAEAGQILDRVQQMNIPVKVKGTTVYVDSKQVDFVKVKLAEEGYPKSTLTYDIFMKGTSWAMTDSDKQKLALYQVQNRLQDTICTIPGVQSAQVTIGLKDQNSYVLSTESSPVTASVKLTLVPGGSLTPQQVRGIVLLVSRSVPDLEEKNVTVLGSDGSPLTDDLDLSSGGADARIRLQSQVEKMITTKVVSLLEPIFGAGKVRVAAGVTMDFSSTVTSTTTYTPKDNGQGVPQTVERTLQAGAATAAGTTEQTSYLVDTVNQQIEDNGGKVQKLTIAVIIDEKSNAAAQSPNVLKETVAYAVGIAPQDVSVQIAPFAAEESPASPAAPLISRQLLIAGGAGLAALLLLLTAFLVIRGRRRRPSPVLFTTPTQSAPVQVLEEAAARNSAAVGDLMAGISRKQVETFAENKPEIVAQILKSWLKEK